MAQFDMSTADFYGSQKGSFFVLKNDMDKAQVRFLYDGMEDIKGELVHKVQVGDKERYVSCLRTYSDPIDKCPFCAAQLKVTPRLFIKLWNEDAQEAQIWERSKAYFQRLASLASRYNPLCNEVVEIERSGVKGDMQTTYEFYPIDNSEFNMDEVECSDPLGTIILDKTAEEMNEYLDTGSFPSDSANVAQARREERQEMPIRRTPEQSHRRAF